MLIGHRCDRCLEVIATDRTLVHVDCGPLRDHHPSIDLCPACAADLAGWLEAGRGPEPFELSEVGRPGRLASGASLP